jgi:hypothetical protein
MSDALNNYLFKVRPDALGHYFKFLKDAGNAILASHVFLFCPPIS